MEILIIDNTSIHRNPRVLDLCTAAGVVLEYLPPYCPIFNPIKGSFHDLKAYIRRYYKRGTHNVYLDFEGFFRFTVKTMARGPEAERRARGHFRNAGYRFAEQY